MTIYTLKKDAFTLGDEPHPDFGYSWRASVLESDFPIQWSSKRQDWTEGTKIAAKTSEKKTAKSSGKEYLWLTGVDKVSGSGEADLSSPPPTIKEPRVGASLRPKAAAEPSREQQVTRNMVWKNLLGHAGTPTTEAEVKTFMKLVDLHTRYLLKPSGVSSEMPEDTPRDIKDFSDLTTKEVSSAADKVRESNPKLFKKQEPEEDWMEGLEEPNEE